MARRAIERERAGADQRRPASRVRLPKSAMAAKLNWQQGRRRGFSAHRSFRLTGVGHAIGGERQRRLRAARAN